VPSSARWNESGLWEYSCSPVDSRSKNTNSKKVRAPKISESRLALCLSGRTHSQEGGPNLLFYLLLYMNFTYNLFYHNFYLFFNYFTQAIRTMQSNRKVKDTSLDVFKMSLSIRLFSLLVFVFRESPRILYCKSLHPSPKTLFGSTIDQDISRWVFLQFT